MFIPTSMAANSILSMQALMLFLLTRSVLNNYFLTGFQFRLSSSTVKAFWDFLFAVSKEWGLHVYEQVRTLHYYFIFTSKVLFARIFLMSKQIWSLFILICSLGANGWCKWVKQPLGMASLSSTVWPFPKFFSLLWKSRLSPRLVLSF